MVTAINTLTDSITSDFISPDHTTGQDAGTYQLLQEAERPSQSISRVAHRDLLRNWNGGRYGSDLEAELAGLALEVAEGTFFKELFISFLAGFDVSLAKLEHAINQAGKFVGPGVNGRRCSKTGFNASDKSPDGSFTLHSALCSQAQPPPRDWHFCAVYSKGFCLR